jgi:tetratricopeptide (TPR) repeat protein
MTENYEPITWVEEVIQPARAVGHPRLAFMYVIASLCWTAGRVEAAVGYAEACQTVLSSGRGELPFGIDGLIGAVYLTIGQPERYVEVSRAQLARGRGADPFARASLALALAAAGSQDEAMNAATGLIEAAEATRNPCALSLALLAHGYVFREANPVRALAAVRRGLMITQDSGQRAYETHMAANLARLEAEHGDPLAALDYLSLAIRNYHDSGNPTQMHPTLAILAVFLDRLGRYESAATIAGFARSPFTTAAIPELDAAITHLCDILGDQTYEALARKGETMTTAAMVTYAYDQIDQARAELTAVSK